MYQSYKMHSCARGISILCLLVSGVSNAAEWNRGAAVRVGATYTDNVCLSSGNEDSKVIGRATPSIRLAGKGARASMQLNAALQFNTLDQSSTGCSTSVSGEKESPAPRLNFAGDSILVENFLYFDATAFVAQNKVNPFGVGGGDNLNGSGNTNTIHRYSLTPYISRRISEKTSLLLRYTFSAAGNSEPELYDTKKDLVVLDVGTSPQLSKISYGITGRHSDIEYEGRTALEDTQNSELSSIRFRTSYQLITEFQINGYYGVEENDFISSLDETDGELWDLGFLWTPNERISIAAGTGNRFFGNTPRLDISYRHKRSRLRASYNRDLTYDQTLRGRDETVSGDDEFVDAPNQGGSVDFAGSPTTITNSPILDERFTLGYFFRGRRTTANIFGSYSEQTRSADTFTDIFTSVSVSGSRSLSRNLTVDSRISWSEREADPRRLSNAARNSDTWRFRAGLSRTFTSNTSASLNYLYTDRSSELGGDEYTENRFTFSLRYTF